MFLIGVFYSINPFIQLTLYDFSFRRDRIKRECMVQNNLGSSKTFNNHVLMKKSISVYF